MPVAKSLNSCHHRKLNLSAKFLWAPLVAGPKLNHMNNCLPSQFQALGDRTRLAVIERLLNGPASVSELAKPHDMALPAFTKHLGVLERSGLITSTKTGRVRTCAINPKTFTNLEQWFLDRRTLWESRLHGLAQHLAESEGD